MGNSFSITSENGQEIFNTCWMSANDYGVIQLLENSTATSAKIEFQEDNISIYPTCISNSFQVSINSVNTGKVVVELYKLNGLKAAVFNSGKTSSKYKETFYCGFLSKGLYVARVILENKVFVSKIVKQ
jgi:hypothetical protein